MSERISVTITAQDGASKTFTAIASSATKMGDAVEKAGTEGTQSLNDLDKAAAKSGKSMADLERQGAAIGAAMGTLVSVASLLGASYRDQQRQIDAINRAYGDQADEILAVTEQIQDYTRFSNDAAREGALFATALVDAYGLTGDQVGILLERSADLAQMYGISLPDAIMRTAGAIRGEGEAAERLGLNMSDAAIAARALQDGITNWNVPGALSEAEKAAYRFQVFLEDTEQSVGAAADATENAGGQFRQFINDVQDAQQAVGGFLGPVGEVAAEMAPIAIALPVVGAGLGKFGGWLRSTAAGAKVASASMSALSFAISPVGIALAGILAIGGSIALGWLEQKRAADEYKATLEDLSDTLFQISQAGNQSLVNQVNETTASITALHAAVEATKPKKSDEEFADLDPDELFNNINAAQTQFTEDLRGFEADVTQITANINEALSHPEIDATPYLDWIERLSAQAASTKTRTDDLAIAEMIANTTLEEFTGTTQNAVLASEKFANSLGEVASRAKEAGDAVKSGVTDRIDNLNQATTDWLSNGDNILRFWLELTEGANQGAAAFDGTAAELEAFQAQMDAAADFRGLVQLAEDADNTAEALDAVLRTFQQIDELGQRSAQAESIATALVGEPGEWAVIDDLLASARIGIDDYNAAVAAGASIQQSNLAVQEDLNAMRAQQLPLLAQEEAAYAAMIDQISQLPALEQRRALALMDSSVQAQIASQYATAYSASLGEIPTEVATNMIVSAAEADPVLKDLLLQFGLIEEGADGTITVNFPDGPTVQESVMALTESIDALTLAMGGIPPLHIEADTQQALAEALGVKQAVDDLDGTTATVHADAEVNSANGKINSVEANLNDLDGSIGTVIANATDNASGKLSSVMALIRALDGLTANTTVTTTYRSVGNPGGGPTPFAMGGLVGYAAGGLIPFRGGEAGPEMLHLANGGQVPLMTDSIYAAPANSYVSPHNANTNYSQGGDTFVFNIAPGNDVDGIRRFMRDEFLPSFKGEYERHITSVTGGTQ